MLARTSEAEKTPPAVGKRNSKRLPLELVFSTPDGMIPFLLLHETLLRDVGGGSSVLVFTEKGEFWKARFYTADGKLTLFGRLMDTGLRVLQELPDICHFGERCVGRGWN
jgi:hypothetical protein